MPEQVMTGDAPRQMPDGTRVADPSTRNTWVLVVFTAVTNLADGVTKLTLPLIATSLTRSPALVSGVLLTLTLPWLLVALHVGVLVDRADRRTLLRLAGGMRIVAIVALLAAVAAGRISLPMLYAAGAVLGIAEVIALTSAAAIVPDAVAPSGRERVNTWVTGAETLCNEFAGPSVGGVLIAVGTWVALTAVTGAYLIAIAVLALLVGRFQVSSATDQPRPPVHAQIIEGVQFLWHQAQLRMLALTATVLVSCWAAWFALMPLAATRTMGLTAAEYGLLVGALGVGGLIGTLSIGTANRLLGRRSVMFANIFLTAAMVAVPAVTTNVWAIGFAAILGGLGGTLWTVNSRTISQQLVTTDMMGRYSSAARLFSWGAIPVGAALAGTLAQTLRYQMTLGVFALATILVTLPFLRAFNSGAPAAG